MKVKSFAALILVGTGTYTAIGPTSWSQEPLNVFDRIKAKQTNNEDSDIVLSAEELAFKQQYDAQFAEFASDYLIEFAAFKIQHENELQAFRNGLLEQWGEVEISDNAKVVSYPEPDTKAVVDFERQEIVISVLHDKDEMPDLGKVTVALRGLADVSPPAIQPTQVKMPAFSAPPSADAMWSSIQSAPPRTNTRDDVQKPLETDNPSPPASRPTAPAEPVNVIASFAGVAEAEKIIASASKLIETARVETVIPRVDEDDIQLEAKSQQQRVASSEQLLDVLADNLKINSPVVIEQAKSSVREASTSRVILPVTNPKVEKANQNLEQKRVTKYRVQINFARESQRIADVKEDAEIFAAKWKLPLELVIAVIDTESSFNPLAVSHIPAYGLMQIVPVSAGIDVNQFLYKKRQPLDQNYLFDATNNIEAGSAYLHILNSRYLKKITSDENRLFCVIAAYNTGVGNVSRAFSDGKVKRLNQDVVNKINGMTPTQVYETLREQLPYDETKNYLKKVDTKMSHYRQVLAGIN